MNDVSALIAKSLADADNYAKYGGHPTTGDLLELTKALRTLSARVAELETLAASWRETAETIAEQEHDQRERADALQRVIDEARGQEAVGYLPAHHFPRSELCERFTVPMHWPRREPTDVPVFAAPVPAQPSTKESRAFLIENNYRSTPHWLTLGPDFVWDGNGARWTDDADKALKFADADSAQVYLRSVVFDTSRVTVTEHIFETRLQPSAPVAQPAWAGCGECDCSFACHEGRAPCIRQPSAPVAQPPDSHERQYILREAEQIAASDAYFNARHFSLDTIDRRKVFEAGFLRGYDVASVAQPAPAVADDVLRDAARYRFLRNCVSYTETVNANRLDGLLEKIQSLDGKAYAKAFDAAIDTALAASAPPCLQVNDGVQCMTPRAGNARLCPDCNPREASAPKESQR